MDFYLTTLGVASARPTSNRYPSAHLLTVGGRLFLLDCGEAAQMLLVKNKVSLLKIDNVFISHLHGDHIFGLFGFIYSVDMMGRLAPLHIYAPQGLEEIIGYIQQKFGKLNYEIVFHKVNCTSPTVIMEFKNLSILSFPLNHRVETYGYIFKGEWRNNPRSFAYCSDTAPYSKLSKWLDGVSMLYHEATYMSDNKHLAKVTFHSMASDAAKLARKISAKSLILGHFSSRYKDLNPLLEEAKNIFPNSFLAKEGTKFDVL